MDNPLTAALFVTLIGMAAVFLAMALIYASMRILTTVISDRPESAADSGPGVPSPEEQDHDEIPSPELHAAAIAVALARAEGMASASTPPDRLLGGNTAWGEFYRHRQLRPGGRGRVT